MKKLVLVFGILVSALSVEVGAMSEAEERFSNIVEQIRQRNEAEAEEREKFYNNCLQNHDTSACQALIDNGLISVEQCDKDTCAVAGGIYGIAGYYIEAIPYFEKAIALGNNNSFVLLGYAYGQLNDYFNEKRYYEIGCNKVSNTQSKSCHNLGTMYRDGKGVRQDYHKAAELYKKACDMKYARACNILGALYGKGYGVKQNYSIAKQHFGRACDLGEQLGCDNYKVLNEAGVK